MVRSSRVAQRHCLHAGDNDVGQGASAAETYAAFTACVAMAHEQGWKVVVSTELKRFHFSPVLFAASEEYNALLRENNAGADTVVDFDLDPGMTNPQERNNPDLFTPDCVHPADGGYAVLAGMLVPAIKPLAGR